MTVDGEGQMGTRETGADILPQEILKCSCDEIESD